MLDERLVEAVADVFGLEPAEVTPELNRDNIAEWDSVSHLRLILSIEEAYGRRFPTADIPRLTSVALIQESLERLAAAS